MARIQASTVLLRDKRELTLRFGKESDAAELLEFLDRVLEDGTGVFLTREEMSKTIDEERDWIAGLRNDPNQLLLIGECDGLVVAVLDFRVGKQTRLSHVGSFGVSVHPNWRDCGVGSAVMKRFLSWVEDNEKIEKVCLSVLADNERAIHVYKRFGFVEEGRRKNEFKFADGEYLDDILMFRFFGELASQMPNPTTPSQ